MFAEIKNGVTMMEKFLWNFVQESNAIESIFRDPSQEEVNELDRFMKLEVITIEELQKFVSVYQPDALLRDVIGRSVRVGSYLPPKGGPWIREHLELLLLSGLDPYDLHVYYEKLHPFMDGNGRSGRALWAWKNQDISKGFLLPFYYETLRRS